MFNKKKYIFFCFLITNFSFIFSSYLNQDNTNANDFIIKYIKPPKKSKKSFYTKVFYEILLKILHIEEQIINIIYFEDLIIKKFDQFSDEAFSKINNNPIFEKRIIYKNKISTLFKIYLKKIKQNLSRNTNFLLNIKYPK